MKKACYALGLIILLLVSGSVSAEPKGDSEVGRYKMYFSPHTSEMQLTPDMFLLDTKTGKIWQRRMFTDVKGIPRVWLFQERIDSPEDMMEWISRQEILPDK